VDRIEAAGLCRRRANPDDRRSQIIELTPAGRRLLAKATKTFEDELRRGPVCDDSAGTVSGPPVPLPATTSRPGCPPQEVQEVLQIPGVRGLRVPRRRAHPRLLEGLACTAATARNAGAMAVTWLRTGPGTWKVTSALCPGLNEWLMVPSVR
jgi:DNA-binding MarR family transcriptional regulator